jgi:hypothetical protein
MHLFATTREQALEPGKMAAVTDQHDVSREQFAGTR